MLVGLGVLYSISYRVSGDQNALCGVQIFLVKIKNKIMLGLPW